MSLPVLWIGFVEGQPANSVHDGFESYHFLTNRDGTNAQKYLPAARIRELVEKWHNQYGKADMNYLGHVLNCIADLERLMEGE